MTTTLERVTPFRNESIRDFSQPEDRRSLEAALAKARGALGGRYPLVIAGKRIEAQAFIPSFNPARPAEVVGHVAAAGLEQAAQAVSAAAHAFGQWKTTTAGERAGVLFRAAAEVRRRRDEFNALLVLEVGKPWVEADADTAEAIDFLEFYAREALRYDQPLPLTPVAGEKNQLKYIPLGVGIVIPPWNFAFAIMAGMLSAALVTGNTVVLKPSSDAAVIAAVFVDLMNALGLPPGVLNFVPGDGATIGDALVANPQTRFIAFTGSKEVGLRINEVASKTQPGQKWIKRVIAEMGGKDAIIVAADADLDLAVEGVVASAYGFSGQKCSACSRAIVDATIYDGFMQRLEARVARLSVGDPLEQANYMGPVINEKAMKKMLAYIEHGKQEGRLVAGGSRSGSDGFFVQPTVIADVKPDAKIMQEEIFGPVLAVTKAKDFDEALAIANNTEFGLTGSVYSKDPKKLERAAAEFFVGNLYFNRKSTGALVCAHPFGGFNMSGTDSKAGGPDYLLLFMQAKTISEKIG